MVILGYALIAVVALVVLLLVLFLIIPDRVKDFFGTTAMWARSLGESRALAKTGRAPRKHKRHTDAMADPEHTHRRATPRPEMLQTVRQLAQPPRASGPRARPTDPEAGA